jgi:hypothetical protein
MNFDAEHEVTLLVVLLRVLKWISLYPGLFRTGYPFDIFLTGVFQANCFPISWIP